ncbi:MAG TPA: DUF1360 domain-containing protein [Gaiellales bacterium]|jgi:hypothetical protein|nr:DUF1360 domain-containing protein [Gaiellales bacterium]
MTSKTDPRTTYPGYAALTGAFLAGTGAALAGLSRRDRLPARFTVGDVTLLGVATYQLSRTLSRDRVTAFLREPFAKQGDSVGRGEVESEAEGEGLRRAVGELLICPFCMTQWVGAAFLVGLCAAPRPTRFAASLFALRTVAESVNIAHEAAVARVDRMQNTAKVAHRRVAAA